MASANFRFNYELGFQIQKPGDDLSGLFSSISTSNSSMMSSESRPMSPECDCETCRRFPPLSPQDRPIVRPEDYVKTRRSSWSSSFSTSSSAPTTPGSSIPSSEAYLKAPPPFLPVKKVKPKIVFTYCAFCKNNGEDKSFYEGHTLKDDNDQVICPVLSNYVCPICQATGSMAHTIKHCPSNPESPRGKKLALQSQRMMIEYRRSIPDEICRLDDHRAKPPPTLAPIGSHLKKRSKQMTSPFILDNPPFTSGSRSPQPQYLQGVPLSPSEAFKHLLSENPLGML